MIIKKPSSRWLALDALRGITIAVMVLVNHPGYWRTTYPILEHAAWDGCTLADLVFPTFLLLVGVSTVLSLEGGLAKGTPRHSLLLRAARRGAILAAIGFGFHLLENQDLATVRIPGVLQRIGVSFLIGAALYLYTGWRVWVGLTVVIWAGAYYLTYLSQGPGGVPWYFWVEGQIFGQHVYIASPPGDPEGVFSLITSLPTLFIGFALGRAHRAGLALERGYGLAAAGLGLMAAGGLLHLAGLYPMNKYLWTPSYVLYTAGLAMVVLWGLSALLHAARRAALLSPALALGANSLLLYVASEGVAFALGHRFAGVKLRELIFPAYGAFLPAFVDSLAYALTMVGVFTALALWLQRRGVYWKV